MDGDKNRIVVEPEFRNIFNVAPVDQANRFPVLGICDAFFVNGQNRRILKKIDQIHKTTKETNRKCRYAQYLEERNPGILTGNKANAWDLNKRHKPKPTPSKNINKKPRKLTRLLRGMMIWRFIFFLLFL